MRFQLSSKSPEELRPRVLAMQNEVRDVMARIRALERQSFFLVKDIHRLDTLRGESGEADITILIDTERDCARQMEAAKDELVARSEQLAMTVTCFKDKLIGRSAVAVTMTMADEGNGWTY